MLRIDDLPGRPISSRGYGLSADGSVVVGERRAFGLTEAFRWTAETGMVGLGSLSPESPFTGAKGRGLFLFEEGQFEQGAVTVEIQLGEFIENLVSQLQYVARFVGHIDGLGVVGQISQVPGKIQ